MIQIEEERFKKAIRQLSDLRMGLMGDILDPGLSKEKFKNQVSLNTVNEILRLLKNNESNKNTSN